MPNPLKCGTVTPACLSYPAWFLKTLKAGQVRIRTDKARDYPRNYRGRASFEFEKYKKNLIFALV